MTRYVVVCRDHTTKPYRTRADAERARDRIIEMGECPLDHEVVEVDR